MYGNVKRKDRYDPYLGGINYAFYVFIVGTYKCVDTTNILQTNDF